SAVANHTVEHAHAADVTAEPDGETLSTPTARIAADVADVSAASNTTAAPLDVQPKSRPARVASRANAVTSPHLRLSKRQR
ncbi:hypothetical protein, partial [Staphylococcus aureus]|uniref:hypothetical protein n=1 Tax=Staphylococcus aureus TaxID=1280 RepID=UPI001E2BF0BA